MIIGIEEFFAEQERLPVVDVRSESEFRQGHIASAVNIPLLNDAERIVVGTTYKQKGQKDAIREGFRLVGPRLNDLIREAENIGQELIVHCWRGGMRSSNFCQFAGMIGIKTRQVAGGYKAYRQVALDSFKTPFRFRVISGFTGSGKSELLRILGERGEQVIDLEGLANHKGSVFGGLGMPPQPTTEQFQNDLFEQIRILDPARPVWVEDESIAVGKIFIPSDFWQTMNQGGIITLDVPKEERIARLVAEYRNVPPDAFHEAMKGIMKRLGGQHFNAAAEMLFAGNLAGAIEIVLTYYDKAYANSLERKKNRIIRDLKWDGRDVAAFAEFLISDELPLQNVLA